MGDIVRMLTLPGTQVPASLESSVKVVAGGPLQLASHSRGDLLIQRRRLVRQGSIGHDGRQGIPLRLLRGFVGPAVAPALAFVAVAAFR